MNYTEGLKKNPHKLKIFKGPARSEKEVKNRFFRKNKKKISKMDFKPRCEGSRKTQILRESFQQFTRKILNLENKNKMADFTESLKVTVGRVIWPKWVIWPKLSV